MHPLKHRRMKAAAVGILPPVGLHATRNQHDKPGQILILRAEAIGHPRSQRRTSRPWRTRQQQQLRRRVVELIRIHRVDNTKVVRHGVQVRNRIGQPLSALAVARPRARAAHQFRRAGRKREFLSLHKLIRTILPVALHQLRFVIEEVEIGRRPGEVEINHPLRLGREMG